VGKWRFFKKNPQDNNKKILRMVLVALAPHQDKYDIRQFDENLG
jgi:hypothetical protein